MGRGLAVGRCQRVEPAPKLVQASGLGPAHELSPHIAWIYGSGQKQAGFKHRLIGHNGEQLIEFHNNKLPLMAIYCNKTRYLSSSA